MAARLIDPEPEAPASDPAPFTPERQMASMLGLCEAQMDSALHESDKAVDALIKAFSGLVDASRAVSATTANLPPDIRGALTGDFEQQVASISKQIGSAVMAFQFYDKLTQRLGHVRYSLSTLALFVCDPAQSHQPVQWERLHNTLRRLYRTEEEKQIFHMLMGGAAGEAEATMEMRALSEEEETQAGEVELF
jgi:hypothetical protein